MVSATRKHRFANGKNHSNGLQRVAGYPRQAVFSFQELSTGNPKKSEKTLDTEIRKL